MRNGLSESFIGHSPAFFRHRKQDTGERLAFILGWRKFIFSTKARSFFWQWSVLERSKKAVPKAEISNGGWEKHWRPQSPGIIKESVMGTLMTKTADSWSMKRRRKSFGSFMIWLVREKGVTRSWLKRSGARLKGWWKTLAELMTRRVEWWGNALKRPR